MKPFDDSRFNFLKVHPREVVCDVRLDRGRESVFDFSKSSSRAGSSTEETEAKKGDGVERDASSKLGTHPLIINASPLVRGHALFVPEIAKCHPQVLDTEKLCFGLSVLRTLDEGDAILGFNSLGAFASVNHFHFQLMFTREMEIETVPVALATPSKVLWTDKEVRAR